MEELTKENMLTHLIEVLTKICGIEVEAGTSVLKNGLLDSIGLVELIVSVQNKFKLNIDLADLNRDTIDTPLLMADFFTYHL